MPVRTLRVGARFNAAVRRTKAGSGTPDGVALSRLLRSMLGEELPGQQDAETLVPPVKRYWFRRVPGQNLWLYFRFDETELVVADLTRSPSIPIE